MERGTQILKLAEDDIVKILCDHFRKEAGLTYKLQVCGILEEPAENFRFIALYESDKSAGSGRWSQMRIQDVEQEIPWSNIGYNWFNKIITVKADNFYAVRVTEYEVLSILCDWFVGRNSYSFEDWKGWLLGKPGRGLHLLAVFGTESCPTYRRILANDAAMIDQQAKYGVTLKYRVIIKKIDSIA